MSHGESDPALTVLVSTVGVNLQSPSRKSIESIVIKAGPITKHIPRAVTPCVSHQESFDPPLHVSFRDKISVSVQCRGSFRNGTTSFSLDPQEILCGANEEDGMRCLYRKVNKNVEVVIGIQSLPSTVGEIVASCSRFRVLIIGESGVGKSSLINKVFGVAGVDVSDTSRGQASIDQEYIASDNQRFIVHDSCGFEAADRKNLMAVRSFIERRRNMRDLKDQLHAVWICLTIPFAGGRLLEAGVEEFLKQRQEILGNIPLVVVFTKLDLLANVIVTEMVENGEPLDDAALKSRRLDTLDQLCVKPVCEVAGSDSISHVAVSTMPRYEDTLSTLVDVTTKNIQTYVKGEAAHYIATIAQRVNISLKVAMTIAVGEHRYWKALMASPNFRGHTRKECLQVIHKDIVAIWNFNDPDNSLHKDDFKEGLLAVPNLRVGECKNITKTVQSSVTVIAALVTIIAGIAGTGGAALPIVVPVVGTMVLAKLAHDLYKASQDVVRQLMAYIVDLTCVMQIIFLLVSARNGTGIVDVDAVGIAMQAYERSDRRNVHAAINEFNVNFAGAPGKRDLVLDEIKTLIERYRIGDEQIPELRRRLSS